MFTQALGLLLSAAGSAWFSYSFAHTWAAGAGHSYTGQPIWGVILFATGLIVWALGRIEAALGPSVERANGSKLSCVLLAVIVLATVGLFLWQIQLGRL